MKYRITLKIFTLIIILYLSLFLSFTFSLRKTKLKFKEDMIDSYVNRGYSFINNEQEFMKDVAKMIMPKKIFNFDLEIMNDYTGDFYVSRDHLKSSLNRNITLFNYEEMKKNLEVTIKGNYRVTTNSDVYKFANSHILRKPIASQIFADTYVILSLSTNHNKNFPSFDYEFVNEVFNIFFTKLENTTKNSEVSDIPSNKEFIQSAIKFFNDYGTHYITQYMFGYRFGFSQEYRNKTTINKDKSGKTPSPNLQNMAFLQLTEPSNVFEATQNNNGGGLNSILPSPNEPNDASNDNTTNSTPNNTAFDGDTVSIANPEKAGNNNNTAVKQIYIGECEINQAFIKPETCNKKRPELVRFEVSPIYNLFHPDMQKKKDYSAGQKKITEEEFKDIHERMKFTQQGMQQALNPNLFVITKIEAFKINKNEIKVKQKCLNFKISVFEKIFKQMKRTKKKMIYKEEVMIKDKHVPVLSIRNYGELKKNYEIITNGEEGLYWCVTRSHNTTPEDLKSGDWMKKKYLIDVRVIVDNDSKKFKDAGFECDEIWSFTDIETKKTNRWHFCTKWTDDFMHPRIITDVKFFDYDQSMGKCAHNYLNAFIDGKSYECDCYMNYKHITDDNKQGDTFLCKSYKTTLFKRPEEPNHPIPKSSEAVRTT